MHIGQKSHGEWLRFESIPHLRMEKYVAEIEAMHPRVARSTA